MLNDMGFLWAVTAVVWLGMLAYAVVLMRRQRRLQQELESLRRALDQFNPPSR